MKREDPERKKYFNLPRLSSLAGLNMGEIIDPLHELIKAGEVVQIQSYESYGLAIYHLPRPILITVNEEMNTQVKANAPIWEVLKEALEFFQGQARANQIDMNKVEKLETLVIAQDRENIEKVVRMVQDLSMESTSDEKIELYWW